MNRSMVLLLLIVVLAGSIWGCGRMRQKKEKEHGVEYTVLGEDQIPDEIRKVVDVKKQEEFQMTYQEEDMLYLLQGYGIQSSGGYSILSLIHIFFPLICNPHDKISFLSI